jgi:hypothetical protein
LEHILKGAKILLRKVLGLGRRNDFQIWESNLARLAMVCIDMFAEEIQ